MVFWINLFYYSTFSFKINLTSFLSILWIFYYNLYIAVCCVLLALFSADNVSSRMCLLSMCTSVVLIGCALSLAEDLKNCFFVVSDIFHYFISMEWVIGNHFLVHQLILVFSLWWKPPSNQILHTLGDPGQYSHLIILSPWSHLLGEKSFLFFHPIAFVPHSTYMVLNTHYSRLLLFAGMLPYSSCCLMTRDFVLCIFGWCLICFSWK